MAIKRAASWLARQELWLTLAAAPLLLFPNRYTPLALLLLIVAWLCRWAAQGAITKRTRLDIPIILLLVALPISLYPSVDLSRSLLKAYGIILGVALFYALVNREWSERGIWLVMNAFWPLGLGVCLLSWLGMATPWEKVFPLPALYQRFSQAVVLPGLLQGEGYHPNEVGGTLSMLVPPSVALLLWSPWPSGRWWRALYRAGLLLAMAVMGALLILTQSRVAFASLVLALALMGVLRGRRALLILPVLVIAGFLALSYFHLTDVFFISITARQTNWQQALLLIAQYPFTGIGLNTYHLISQLNYPYFLLTPFESVFQGIIMGDFLTVHAHNVFLQVWIDLGILGIFGFLGLLAAFVTTARPVLGSGDERLRAYALGLVGGLAAYLAFGLIDTIALGAKPAILIWAFLGLMVVLGQEAQKRQFRKSPNQGMPKLRAAIRWRLLAVVLIGLIPLLLFFGPSAWALNLGSAALDKALLKPGMTADQRAAYLNQAEGLSQWAIRLWPGRSLAYRNLGRIYYARGEYSAAIDAFSQVLELAPADVFTHFDLGQTYAAIGKSDEALAEWVQAGADIYFLDRGDAYASKGAWKEALREYLIAAQIAPASREVFNSLILACNQLQSWDQALAVYAAAIALKPTAPYPHYCLARLWWAKERSAGKAIPELERAIELQPQEAEFHTLLGDIYQSVGRVEEAIAQYTLALQINPGDSQAQQQLKVLSKGK
jgi:tetratricopeptide (TPR) repeat protein/O-antigen ligase